MTSILTTKTQKLELFTSCIDFEYPKPYNPHADCLNPSMLEREEPNSLASRFRDKIRSFDRKIAFPLASTILAVAAACSNGESDSTPTPTTKPTFTPEPTATETLAKPKCIEDFSNVSVINKLRPEKLHNGSNGKLAVVSFSGGLYLTNPDGSGARKLGETRSDGTLEANWSPKGNLLATSNILRRGYHIFDLNGAILANIEESAGISWSPDETSVFYDDYNGIYELNLVSGKSCQIIESDYSNSDRYPALSPDGNKLIFIHNEDKYYITLLNLDRNKIPYEGESRFQNKTNKLLEELLAISASFPPERIRFQWTPDSTKVIFSLTKEGDQFPTIFVADVINNSVAELNTDGFYPFSTLDVDLSNDGTRVAFFDDKPNLYIVNIDGTSLRKIYQGTKGYPLCRDDFELGQKECFGDTKKQSELKFRDDKPRWSPDDTLIGFITALSSFHIENSDGSGEYGHTHFPEIRNDNNATESVSWSPNK